MDNFKSFLGLIPIFFYFLLESFLIGIFINFTWNIILSDLFNYEIKYMEWVGIIWIIKMLLFNVFSLIPFTNKNENNETNFNVK